MLDALPPFVLYSYAVLYIIHMGFVGIFNRPFIPRRGRRFEARTQEARQYHIASLAEHIQQVYDAPRIQRVYEAPYGDPADYIPDDTSDWDSDDSMSSGDSGWGNDYYE
ncbi:hypothetical protein FS749_000472 [Ceratobasidium sp. UAMH 11750]|nr:hypothetical protein FS749_000472 [Ceratobasidium sp. UAMH 11750]